MRGCIVFYTYHASIVQFYTMIGLWALLTFHSQKQFCNRNLPQCGKPPPTISALGCVVEHDNSRRSINHGTVQVRTVKVSRLQSMYGGAICVKIKHYKNRAYICIIHNF